MKKLQNIEKSKVSVIFIGFIFIFWELIVRGGMVPAYILPAPTKVLYTLIKIFPDMLQHLIITLYEAFLGFIMAILLSIIIAVMMDGIMVFKKALYPIIITSQTIPIITLAPLFAMWFGYGYLPKIVVVVLVCFFPITVSLLEGLASVDDELLGLLKSMGASKLQIYKMVKFPAVMPNFFSGLKISGTYSIMGAIIGEWMGGKKGLGVYMIRVRHSFAIDKVFATIIVITLLSIILLKLINILEKKCMPWSRYLNKDYEEEIL
ncbi:ABC transporter permease [Crassaminicella thermophila]|uniref:ABC transporter permease n=1 Tax=Crassaminicella thermophila TaxID=2599308 RepID=A0A5C0SF07_CRATE|nr:ABC transporter permease [Crassaminicella thermophila]QEK12522.1 ABC transporter permease [Crassaminicella thermophila]